MTFWGHVTSTGLWPFDTSYRYSIVSNRLSIWSRLREIGPETYLGHDPHYVIDHVKIRFTMLFPIGAPLKPSPYISERLRVIRLQIYLGHDIDLSRSHDVIGHVTIRFYICGFLLVFQWNQASISKRFRDFWLQIYRGHDLDLSGSRDVIGHVTIYV